MVSLVINIKMKFRFVIGVQYYFIFHAPEYFSIYFSFKIKIFERFFCCRLRCFVVVATNVHLKSVSHILIDSKCYLRFYLCLILEFQSKFNILYHATCALVQYYCSQGSGRISTGKPCLFVYLVYCERCNCNVLVLWLWIDNTAIWIRKWCVWRTHTRHITLSMFVQWVNYKYGWFNKVPLSECYWRRSSYVHKENIEGDAIQ